MATGVLVGTFRTGIAAGECPGAVRLVELEGPDSIKNVNWVWLERRGRGAMTGYSHSRALFASTHVEQGRLASHLCGVVFEPT
jgi:hypothetical protein